MAHELEVIDGKASMFYVGETPWHDLGTELDDPPSIEEAIKLAGLDWNVGLKQLVTQDGQEIVPAYATYRESDNKILGVVGKNYHVLQNSEAFKFFQPLIDSKDVSLETAGSLKDGKRIWILASINSDPLEIVKNDIVKKYVLLSNSHDGTLAVRCGFTAIRVVCNNTLSFAHNDKAGSQLIRIRHSSKVTENLEQIRDIMSIADRQFHVASEYYKLLANNDINTQDLLKYVRVSLGISEKDAKEVTRAKNRINEVINLFENGRGNQLPGVSGTYWAGYNAIAEYLSYNRGSSQGSRLDSLWFGDSARINKSALEIGVSMATGV